MVLKAIKKLFGKNCQKKHFCQKKYSMKKRKQIQTKKNSEVPKFGYFLKVV